MKKIEILGPGCPKCQKTTELIEEEMKEADVEAESEEIFGFLSPKGDRKSKTKF